MLSKKLENRYVVRLERGEDVISALSRFAEKSGIRSGCVQGIGAIENVELGYFNRETKEYQKIRFDGEYELITLMGNYTIVDDKPFLHAHVIISDEACKAFAGHLFSGDIAVTGEFFITPTSDEITREFDEDTGLNLMKL